MTDMDARTSRRTHVPPMASVRRNSVGQTLRVSTKPSVSKNYVDDNLIIYMSKTLLRLMSLQTFLKLRKTFHWYRVVVHTLLRQSSSKRYYILIF